MAQLIYQAKQDKVEPELGGCWTISKTNMPNWGELEVLVLDEADRMLDK